ncbi:MULTISPECIES: phosphotransferase family protein [Cyanophyceae]|uniref:phosphotransferase family protein n=1 Tax=Cyanophyceae TaxID=3028117 RepID=UPI0002F170F1|nr:MULTISPECIES: phosphotransferase [Cyanophyceae]SMH34445.1 Phosphotransferase enzyme family protein [Picosynechococcus sp. OG1]SMQ84611.1 Phosphotransferase enzyme family protein [Synechococcus sp. 7002]
MSIEFSNRLGLISELQLQAALAHFNLGDFIKAEPILFGNFRQNLYLTSTKGEYVLRGVPHTPWQFEHEKFFYKLLFEKTKVPVPLPFLIDYSDDIFGWSYVIMPRIKGLNLSDPKVKNKLTENDLEEISKAMGENLILMQELYWDFPGHYDPKLKSIKKLNKKYQEWIFYQIYYYLDLSIRYSKITHVDILWVDNLLKQGIKAMQYPFKPCFVMQDYKEDNVVLEKSNDCWKVAGIFDLVDAYFGDGETDLSRNMAIYLDKNPNLINAFFRTYAAKRKLRPGFERRFPIYMLKDRLMVWEFVHREKKVWWQGSPSLHEWAERYTSIKLPNI